MTSKPKTPRVRNRVAKAAPVARGPFDESVGLDDPRPFATWEPSPRQILEWAAQIRDENNERAGLVQRSAWERSRDDTTDLDDEQTDDQASKPTGLFLKPEGHVR